MGRNPSELSEQITLVRALRRHGILFCAVPNGGLRTRQGAMRLKASGVERGVPDILIFDSPPNQPDKRGLAIELKRVGAPASSVGLHQQRWLNALDDRGWLVVIAYGANDALELLRSLEYID